MTYRNLGIFLIALLATWGAGPALGAGTPVRGVCDLTTVLTLVGMDTRAGRMLFTLPALGTAGEDDGRRWLLELDTGASEARLFPAPAGHLFAGSIGPGPVFAVEACGAGCLQPFRWQGGSFEPLGERLTVPPTTTTHTTYDAGGRPWVVLHEAMAPPPGSAAARAIQAWGFYLEGREWRNRGRIEVWAVGSPGAAPAPRGVDGVVSGSGLFTASAPPRAWVPAVPKTGSGGEGRLIALEGELSLLAAGDGEMFLSTDGGETWGRSIWSPRPDAAAGELWLDLPISDRRGTLGAVWTDRGREPETLYLAELIATGRWRLMATLAAEVKTDQGEHLRLDTILQPRPGLWTLIAGCIDTVGGSGLIVRGHGPGGLERPRFVSIVKGSP